MAYASVNNVTTFTELTAAVNSTIWTSSGKLVEVAADISFSTDLYIPPDNTIEITSNISALLDGGNSVRLFRVEGELTLRSLRLKNGAAGTYFSSCSSPYEDCAGGAIYVGYSGSLVLNDCDVQNNQANVRLM